jgi:hypothetical protein
MNTVVIIVSIMLSGYIGALIGQRRGRGMTGALLSIVLGPLGWLIVIIMPDANKAACPACRTMIPFDASICANCRTAVYFNSVQGVFMEKKSTVAAPALPPRKAIRVRGE